MDLANLIDNFLSILPMVSRWIDNVLDCYKDQAIAITDFGFPNLEHVFPSQLLEKAKVVVVSGKIPFPPLRRMGLTELLLMEKMPMAGITYKDTFFVQHAHQSESLYFHEMVHIVQWDRLGVDKFLLAYGIGLMKHGYRDSPLEEMAYSLEESFINRDLPNGIVDFIGQKTDEIWNSLALFL